MKPTMYEMKNTLDRINGREDITEAKVSALEDIDIETSKMKNQRKQFLKNEQSMYELWIQLKYPNNVIGAFVGAGHGRK